MHQRPLDGIICLGHSNVHMSYMIKAIGSGGTEPGGSGANNLPQNRWTEMLSVLLGGVRVVNYGQNGRSIPDYYASGGGDHFLLQTAYQRAWFNERAKIIVMMFGLNDDMIPREEAQAQYRILLTEALSTGAHVVSCTDVAVDYPTHYNVDRNIVISSVNDALTEVALELGCTICDFYARSLYEISQGNWDQRCRANNTTFDNSQDASPPSPWDVLPPADWFTNVHLNVNGATLVAEELASTISGMGIL